MTPRINFILQFRAFMDFVREPDRKINPSDISVYIYIFNENNRLNWRDKIYIDYQDATFGARVSKNTFYKSLKILKELGLIDWEKGKNGSRLAQITVLPLSNICESDYESSCESDGNVTGKARGTILKQEKYKTIKLGKEEIEIKNKEDFQDPLNDQEIEEKENPTKEKPANATLQRHASDEQLTSTQLGGTPGTDLTHPSGVISEQPRVLEFQKAYGWETDRPKVFNALMILIERGFSQDELIEKAKKCKLHDDHHGITRGNGRFKPHAWLSTENEGWNNDYEFEATDGLKNNNMSDARKLVENGKQRD